MSEVEAPVVRDAAENTDVVAGWFNRHARPLAEYAARRVGPNLARDIVADTFRVACEQFDRYDPAQMARNGPGCSASRRT